MHKKKAVLTPVDVSWLTLNSTRIHYNFFEINRALRDARRAVSRSTVTKPGPAYKRARIVYTVNPEYVKRTRSLVRREDHALEQLSPPEPLQKERFVSLQKANELIMDKFNTDVYSIESLIKSTAASKVYPVDIFTAMSAKLKEVAQLLDKEISSVDHTRYIADYINEQVNTFGNDQMNEVIKNLGTPLKFDMSPLHHLPLDKKKEKLKEMVCEGDESLEEVVLEQDQVVDLSDNDDDNESAYRPPLSCTDITLLPNDNDKVDSQIVTVENYD